MIAIPVLEIRNGICSGAPAHDGFQGISLDDPVSIAQAWSAAGFKRLHVVDHDALSGIGSNASVIDDICREAGLEIQANGGVQTSDGIQQLLDAGATRVVVGTRGIAEAEWLASIVESNPGRVLLETALKEGKVIVRGWVRSLPMDIFDIAESLDGLPLAGLVVSASQSDGIRATTDLSLLEDIAEACQFPVLASGGVSSLSDLRALEHRGLAGVIMSANLFTGEIDVRWVAREFSE
jgi:phosphoribosylformimino-5-aminoimidazole carboxamide ribonucleotide (ProFAR) isomerase